MKQQENAREAPDDHTTGARRDHRRRARSEWQRQQYRVAEPELASDEEANPHEPVADDGA